MNFDLTAIEASTRSTFDVEVGNRDDGSPVGFKVLGPGSEEYAKADRAIQLLNVKEAAARKVTVNLETDEGAGVIVDGSEKRRQVVIDQCVVGWYGFTIDDKPAEFTPANLARVLRARPNWVRRLVAAIEDEANFVAG